MNTTGKRNRKNTGLNRYALHFARHTHKSQETRLRKGWITKGKIKKG